MGSGVLGGQGDQGTVTLGLPERFELLDEHATPAGTQEGRQAPAQALGGLLPGVVLEELDHGVSGGVVLRGEGPVRACPAPQLLLPCCMALSLNLSQPLPNVHSRGTRPTCQSPYGCTLVPWLRRDSPEGRDLSFPGSGCPAGPRGGAESYRKHGRRGRHVPLGLGGGGTVGLQEGQVAAAETALFHDATAAAVDAACGPAWKSHRRKQEWPSAPGRPQRGQKATLPSGRPHGTLGHPTGTASRGVRSAGGKQEPGRQGWSRKDRSDNGGEHAPGQPPGLLVPLSSDLKWARPPGPTQPSEGSGPHVTGP